MLSLIQRECKFRHEFFLMQSIFMVDFNKAVKFTNRSQQDLWQTCKKFSSVYIIISAFLIWSPQTPQSWNFDGDKLIFCDVLIRVFVGVLYVINWHFWQTYIDIIN